MTHQIQYCVIAQAGNLCPRFLKCCRLWHFLSHIPMIFFLSLLFFFTRTPCLLFSPPRSWPFLLHDCCLTPSHSLFPPRTEGRLEVNMSEISLEEVERSLLEGKPNIAPGGYWKPTDCLPRWKVSAHWKKTILCVMWPVKQEIEWLHRVVCILLKYGSAKAHQTELFEEWCLTLLWHCKETFKPCML